MSECKTEQQVRTEMEMSFLDGLQIRSQVNEEPQNQRTTQFANIIELCVDIVEPSALLLEKAIKTLKDTRVLENLLDLCSELPGVAAIVKLVSVIYLGVQTVRENQENCQNLWEYIKGVIKTVAQASQQNYDMFVKASQDVGLDDRFQELLKQAVKLIQSYQERHTFTTFWNFLKGKSDKEQFQNIYNRLNAMLALFLLNMNMVQNSKQNNEDLEKINEFYRQIGGDIETLRQMFQNQDNYEQLNKIIKNQQIQNTLPKCEKFQDNFQKQRLMIEEKITQLGDGDLDEGFKIFKEANEQNGCLEDAEKQQKYNDVIENIPYGLLPQEVTQKAQQIVSNLMIKISLPQDLSEELKQFWVDNFGYTKSVKWTQFLRAVESQNKVYLNSILDCKKRLRLTNCLKEMLISKEMPIHSNQDIQVEGADLKVLYKWCMDIWKQEGKENAEGNLSSPTTIRAILELLLKHSDKVNNEITKNKELNFCYNGIAATGVHEHIQIFEDRLWNVRKLILSNNPIGDDGAQVIFNYWESMPHIKILMMQGCRLQKLTGIQYILPQLEQISLGNNQIGDNGAALIAEGLGYKNKKRLDLQDLLQYIFQQQQQQQQQQQLHLQSSSIDNNQTDGFDVPKKNIVPYLKVLDLHNNKISDEGLEIIMNGIKTGQIKITEKFDFSENNMTQQGFQIMLDVIKIEECQLMKEIYLNGYSNFSKTDEFHLFSEEVENRHDKIKKFDAFYDEPDSDSESESESDQGTGFQTDSANEESENFQEKSLADDENFVQNGQNSNENFQEDEENLESNQDSQISQNYYDSCDDFKNQFFQDEQANLIQNQNYEHCGGSFKNNTNIHKAKRFFGAVLRRLKSSLIGCFNNQYVYQQCK